MCPTLNPFPVKATQQAEGAVECRLDRRVADFHVTFAAIADSVHGGRGGFQVPVLCLALRAAFSEHAQASFPLWVQTEEGHAAVRNMDQARPSRACLVLYQQCT